jgi:hypothetical protein
LDRVFQDLNFDFLCNYLDYVIIYSENFEAHFEHNRLVLDRLRQASLAVKPEQVVFAMKEISLFGHLVSPAGMCIDPERTRAIREFPNPGDVRGISRFVVTVNFYHKFIPRLADFAAPHN